MKKGKISQKINQGIPVTVYLPADLAHRARIAAATQNRGRSPLVCDALFEYLERHNLLASASNNKEAAHAQPG